MLNNKDKHYAYTASYESKNFVSASEMFGPFPQTASVNAAINCYNSE